MRWHADLVRRLSALPGVSVAVRWVPDAGEPLPTCLAVLFALEGTLHGLRPGLAAPAEPDGLPAVGGPSAGGTDVTLNLTAHGEPGTEPAPPAAGGAPRRWSVTFDGAAGYGAALAAILEGRTPTVEIREAPAGRVLASGRPGADDPHIALSSFEAVLARTTTLILAAVRGRGPLSADPEAASALSCAAVLRRGGRAVARAAVHRLYRLLYRSPHWRVGWRFVEGPDVVDLGRHPDSGWRDLADDGSRFYADPFPIVAGGRAWLFVEDLPHRTQKGVISAVAFDASGPVGAPRPVLERPYHLSYPFVFEEEGEVWMVPETSAARRIELYRATRFPEGWAHEGVLVEDVEASDATLFRHAGRWWMSATVRDGGSWSDALHLWWAADFRGPWTAHPGNPVVVDVASARPAGRVVSRGDRLVRPVQDGRVGYGSALALAEIDRLDTEIFSQRIVARITAGPLWPGRRIHTLNRAGGLECIDGSALAPRWRRRSFAA